MDRIEVEPVSANKAIEDEGPKVGYDKFTPAAISTLLGSWLVHVVVGS